MISSRLQKHRKENHMLYFLINTTHGTLAILDPKDLEAQMEAAKLALCDIENCSCRKFDIVKRIENGKKS